jgi:hypothetical protein
MDDGEWFDRDSAEHDLPSLSDLLAHEMAQVALGVDTDDGAAEAGPWPRLLASVDPSVFAESVQEEADWLLERDARLSLTARRRLLNAVDTALAVREHLRTPFTELDRELRSQLPSEGDAGWADAQEMVKHVNCLACGELRPSEFPVRRAEQVTSDLGLPTAMVFAYVDQAIAEAMHLRPGPSFEPAALRANEDPLDLAEYDLLRVQMREALLRDGPGGPRGR